MIVWHLSRLSLHTHPEVVMSCLRRIIAYTVFAGELREQVEKARRITVEQKVVLDKIRHIHRYFQGLELVCEAVEDVSLACLPEFSVTYKDTHRSIRISRPPRSPSFHYTE